MLSRLLVCVALFATVLPSPRLVASTAEALPPRIQAPNDQSEYRRFTLENGLKVLLVSDPKFNKSAAALTVAVDL